MLRIRPVWSESSLSAQWVAKDIMFLHVDSEGSDQTGRMPRLIWFFAGRTLILLVLSCRGSNMVLLYLHTKHSIEFHNHIDSDTTTDEITQQKNEINATFNSYFL